MSERLADRRTRTTAPRLPDRGRRGMAMILVLVSVAVALALILGLSLVSVQGTSAGISRNIESHATARMIAESGLEVAIVLMNRAGEDWDKEYGEGTWDSPTGDLTLTAERIEAGDGGDEGLFGEEGGEEEEPDVVLIGATGRHRGVTHTVHAELTLLDTGFRAVWIENP